MKNHVKIALLLAVLLGAAPAALSDPLVRGGGGGGRGGGGSRGGGGGARSRPASSRGSVRNTRPAPQPRASRPAPRPARSTRPAQPARSSQPARSTRPAQPARPSTSDRGRPSQSDRQSGARSAPTATTTSASRSRAVAAGGFVGSRTPPRGTKVGTSVSNLPVSAQSVTMRGSTYHYAGGVFHSAGAGGYRVTRAPVGAVVRRPLPGGCWRYWWGRRWYWYYGGVYYCDHDYYDDDDDDDDEPVASSEPAAETAPAAEAEPAEEAEPAAEPEPTEAPPEPLEFEVVEPTIGAKVPYLPEGANAVQAEGVNLFEYQGTYYKPTLVDGEIAYEVVAPPK